MRKLVTISREYGSGGSEIGRLLAEKLNVPFYDKEIIDLAVIESGFSREMVEGAELKAKSGFAYNLSAALNFQSGLSGDNMPVNERVFIAQARVITNIAKENEGVIVGRCADYILKDEPGVTNVFIHGEFEDRVEKAIKEYGIPEAKAVETVKSVDKARQNYYAYHTTQKWGEFSNYNLAINSSYITEEEAASLIADYVERRTYK